jgi:hypothetical protein
MVDDRLLADRIDAQRDGVADATGGDLHPPFLPAAHDEGHGDDRLQCVALGAAGRCDVVLTAGDSLAEVQDAGDGVGGKAGAVVGDGDAAVRVQADCDLGRSARLLAGIQGVVDQLLGDDQRPLAARVPNLRGQLLLGAEVEQATGRQGGAIQTRGCA